MAPPLFWLRISLLLTVRIGDHRVSRWGRNGTIVFPRLLGSGLSVVPETGGEPKEFTKLDTEENEASHRLPHFLPDGNAVLFTVLRYTTVTPDWKRAQVWVKSLTRDRGTKAFDRDAH